MGDLLGPDPILLPADSEVDAELLANDNPGVVAAAHPSASVAWAALAEEALAEDKAITAYAYARTGYHRGLDQLRRNGWKGFGPVPYSHEPNRGFLRCVAALARAADTIGETQEYLRCLDLLDDCDQQPARLWASRRALEGLVTSAVRAFDLDGGMVQSAGGQHRACVVQHLGRVRGTGQVRGAHVLAGRKCPHV